MAKFSATSIVESARALYAPKDKNRDILSTGVELKRPTKPEDFVLLPKNHPWIELTTLPGFPFNFVCQVAGSEDCGKSTLGAEGMAAAQKQGCYVILLDAELGFNPPRFEKHFGGVAKEIVVVQSTVIRTLAGGMFKYVKTIMEKDPKAKIFVVHDSIGGAVSKARLGRDIDDEKAAQPGSEAVENSDYMKHLMATFDKYPDSIAVLLVNQMSDKIGFGQKGKSRSGGTKISFFSRIIVEMKKIKTLTKRVNKLETKTGIIVQAKVDKNQLSLTDNSTYKMNIMVDASGWKSTDFSFDKGESDESEG